MMLHLNVSCQTWWFKCKMTSSSSVSSKITRPNHTLSREVATNQTFNWFFSSEETNSILRLGFCAFGQEKETFRPAQKKNHQAKETRILDISVFVNAANTRGKQLANKNTSMMMMSWNIESWVLDQGVVTSPSQLEPTAVQSPDCALLDWVRWPLSEGLHWQ